MPESLTWEPGARSEWQRSASWHLDASASSGFEAAKTTYRHTISNSETLARYAAHHQPFYDELFAQRMLIEG